MDQVTDSNGRVVGWMNERPLYDEIYSKGRVVGKVQGKTYYTKRGPNHYFVKFRGFGISASIIQELVRRSVMYVEIAYDGKEQCVYKTTVGTFLRNGATYHDGDDKQYVLATERMEKEVV